MQKYIEFKFYLKSEETKQFLRELVAHYGTGDKAAKAIVQSYKAGILIEPPKFI